VNTAESNDDDITQHLWIKGTSRNGTYSDVPVRAPLNEAVRSNVITNAYQDVKGVFDVQQNNGDGNVMGIGDVVSANLGARPFRQNGQGHDDTTQKVRVSGTVSGNETTDQNFVTGAKDDVTGERFNVIDGEAFDNFLGLASVQQNNGNGNVIQAGNAVVADIGTDNNPRGRERSSLWVKADGTVTRNTATSSSDPGPSISPTDRDNLITDAFRGPVSGIVNAQQNNGDNNSMNVANAVRAAFLTEADLDTVNHNSVWTVGTVTGNTAVDTEQNRDNYLSGGSFEDATGLFTVQQNNGDNNAVNSATGIVASIYTEADSNGAGVMAGAGAEATVTGNTSTVTVNSDRRNRIDGDVFNDAAGIATVQQNNGDNNVIGASKAVVVAVGSDGDFAGFNGDVMADTALTATVTGNTALISNTSVPPGYENLLTNSFQGYKGIKTVQQNNGNNNAIQSTITVVGNVNTGGGGVIVPPIIVVPGE